MLRRATISLSIILTVVASSANADEYQLYKPQKTRSGAIPVPGDGVLTKTITIQKGDTLSGLSRKYNGRGSFFPQMLLFNKIENPDLIIAGKSLRIPLARSEASIGKVEKAGHTTVKNKHTTSRGIKTPTKIWAPHSPPVGGTAGKGLFNRGVSAFVDGRCLEAIEIFDRYLAAHPNSPQAPDAALYRADCYMRLANH